MTRGVADPIRLVLLALVLGLAASSQAADRPNLIVFLVDDMGVMDTSLPFLTDAKGHPQRYPLNDYYRTPHMEQLAARGVRFSQFYAMSVCSPTRISLLTGQNAARHRTTNWINPDQNNRGPRGPRDWNWRGLTKTSITLPRLLRAQGYRTIHVGKGHFGPRGSEGADPTNLGFDVSVAGASIGAPSTYYGEKAYGNAPGARAPSNAVPGLERFHGTETFLTDALTSEAIAHVRTAVADGKPFYLNLAHYAVHAPFDSDPRFAASYRDSGKPPAAQAFATLIEGMDCSLGLLMQELESLGVSEQTLIVFLGDNGSDAPLGEPHAVACAAPLRGRKGAHYEGGMRVPFIAAWARPNPESSIQKRLPIAPGAIQLQPAAVFDLFPTLLAVADVPLPRDAVVDGTRLDRLLTGQADAAHRNSFLMHYPHAPHRSDYFTVYREGDWKVIYHYFPSAASEGSHYQLYHLGQDPFEQQNLAASHAADLERLMRGLIAALESHNAARPEDASGQPLVPELPGR